MFSRGRTHLDVGRAVDDTVARQTIGLELPAELTHVNHVELVGLLHTEGKARVCHPRDSSTHFKKNQRH